MSNQSLLWKSVKVVLDQMLTAPRRALDEADFVRAALNFANTGSVRALQMQVSGIPGESGPVDDPGYQREADRIAKVRFASDREQFRAYLDQVLCRSTDPDLIDRLNAGARILVIPQFKGNSVGHHFMVEGLSSATSYAVKLFLDRDRPYGKDLHRCQWCECQKFFMTSDTQQRKKHATGLPRTKYCSDQCMFKTRAQRRKEK
jgi:hypothetical protein